MTYLQFKKLFPKGKNKSTIFFESYDLLAQIFSKNFNPTKGEMNDSKKQWSYR